MALWTGAEMGDILCWGAEVVGSDDCAGGG